MEAAVSSAGPAALRGRGRGQGRGRGRGRGGKGDWWTKRLEKKQSEKSMPKSVPFLYQPLLQGCYVTWREGGG